MTFKFQSGAVILVASLLVSACSRRTDTVERRGEGPGDRAPGFVNKVWTVGRSSAVAAGTLYVFLSEGTLIIASSTGKPMVGSWKYEGEVLTIVEEGIAYRVDILSLSDKEFRISSHNPGQPVDITLVPAEVMHPTR